MHEGGATVEVEGPSFDNGDGRGREVAYHIRVFEDGQEIRFEEVRITIARLPDDPDEAASIVRKRVDRLADDLRAKYADQEKEGALRARLASE